MLFLRSTIAPGGRRVEEKRKRILLVTCEGYHWSCDPPGKRRYQEVVEYVSTREVFPALQRRETWQTDYEAVVVAGLHTQAREFARLLTHENVRYFQPGKPGVTPNEVLAVCNDDRSALERAESAWGTVRIAAQAAIA